MKHRLHRPVHRFPETILKGDPAASEQALLSGAGCRLVSSPRSYVLCKLHGFPQERNMLKYVEIAWGYFGLVEACRMFEQNYSENSAYDSSL